MFEQLKPAQTAPAIIFPDHYNQIQSLLTVHKHLILVINHFAHNLTYRFTGVEIQARGEAKCDQGLIKVLDAMIQVVDVSKCIVPADQNNPHSPLRKKHEDMLKCKGLTRE